MRIDIPLINRLSLRIDSSPVSPPPYPTARIQKGLVLLDEGEALCEEGVGFGVPVIKRGLQAIFPSAVELSLFDESPNGITARYKLDLVEKLVKPGSGTINNPLLYHCKNLLASMMRISPPSRGLLTRLSNLLRSSLSWETIYEPAGASTDISLVYLIEPTQGIINIKLDRQDHIREEISEIILMNEQGGHQFDQYQDSNGLSQVGDEIGCWDSVGAEQARFISHQHRISFRLSHVEGSKLFRGREVVGKRLAWSGFGYSFPPHLANFGYEITLRRSA